eukprot:Gb_26612 [translate_table: standard]
MASCSRVLGFYNVFGHTNSESNSHFASKHAFKQSASASYLQRLALEQRKHIAKHYIFYKTRSSVNSRSFRIVKAVTTAPVDFHSQNASSASNLKQELRYLNVLQSNLLAAEALPDKIAVLDRQKRVKSFFEYDGNGNASAPLAFDGLGERQLFLLKGLVAIGQEHVLCVESSWLELEGDLESGVQVQSSSPLKRAFNILLNMIEKWDNSGDAVGKQSFLDLKSDKNGSELVNERNKVRQNELLTGLGRLITTLGEMETFYDCIGGIVG